MYLLTAATSARAQTEQPPTARTTALTARSRLERPHAAVDFDLGVLALPDARVCIRREAGCTHGDASVMVSAWPHYRASSRFAIGGGITLALTPSSSTPRNDPVDVPRNHSRTYFTAEMTGRYFPLVSEGFQAWLGATGGLAVVSDNFEIANNQPEQRVIGQNGANVATEGVTLGIAGGVAWTLSPSLTLGGNVRLADWFLPEQPEHTVLNDAASLSGRVTTIIIAVSVGYQGS